MVDPWETPVAVVVLGEGGPRDAGPRDAGPLLEWANQRLGKVQRIERLVVAEALPRNAMGKVDRVALRAATIREG